MALKPPRYRVTPLPDGTFHVVTTWERVLTEEQMRAEGVPLPRVEVPWQADEAGPPPVTLRRPIFAEVQTALGYWRKNFGSSDARLSDFLAITIKDFGLERVLAAVDAIKAQSPAEAAGEPPYIRFRRLFRQLRREGGA